MRGHGCNPFVTEFTGVPTSELIRLHNMLSGGSWLGLLRRELNLRTPWDAEAIRRGVDPFSWDVISGRRAR